MEDPTLNSRKIRVVYTDPDATDSSSDESETSRKKSRRKFYEIVLPTGKISDKLGSVSDESLASGKLRFVSDESLASPEKNSAGVRKRKRGKYAAEIRDPSEKKRVWLGNFWSAAEAGFGKKREVQNQVRAKRGIWIPSEKGSPTSILDVESSDEGSGGEGKFGYLYGVQVVDENGFLVGEFSKLDDLNICIGEDGAVLAG